MLILRFASQFTATFGFTELWSLLGDYNEQYTDSNEQKLRYRDLKMDMIFFFSRSMLFDSLQFSVLRIMIRSNSAVMKII